MKNNVKTKPKQEQRRIYQYLQTNTVTSAMIAKDLNIPQCNVCRYKAKLQRQNKLIEVGKNKCKVTGYRAMYLSTSVPIVITSELQKLRNHKSSNL